MKALSLTQPWASLVAIGAKRFETRSWKTTHRGLLTIHAAKGFPRECRALLAEPEFYRAFHVHDETPDPLPLGAVVAVVRVIECYATTDDFVTDLRREDPCEIRFGDYSPGRYAWKLELVHRLERPIPARGFQRIFNLEPDVAAAVAKASGGAP